MKKYIGIKLQVEGFHRYEDAPADVAFLRSHHRHIFGIECKKRVKDSNREIEFILFKRKIEDYLERNYAKPCQFGQRSCEMIAEDLMEAFDLDYCKVDEDGENYAEVLK